MSSAGDESKDDKRADIDPASETPVSPVEENPPAVIEKNIDQDVTLSGGRREDRSNWLDNVSRTLTYIDRISKDKSLHFRASDKVTTRLLLGAFLLSVVFATLPLFELNAVAALSFVLADILLFLAIIVFVVSRFGIIRAMAPRHALVCWHLMVGTGMLALVIGFNVVAIVVLSMVRDRLPLLFPGG